MKFLNPWGFLFALLIPGVIILYLLKQQHEEVKISSTFLWEKTLEDMESSVPWQKFRKNILLFLELLAIALVSLAIARPYQAQQRTGLNYIVLLDTSASMQAEDVKPSRFEKAKAEVAKLIDGMLPDERMTIIGVGSRPSIVVNQTSDKGILRGELNKMKAGNGQSDMQEALSFVMGQLKSLQDAQVYIFSDRGYSLDQEFFQSVISTEKPRNYAVTGVSAAQRPEGSIVLSPIANYSQETAKITVECLADGQTIDVREVTVEAGQTANVYWNNIPPGASQVEVHIMDRDDLLLDNRGWLVLEERQPNRVLMVTDRNVFLEKAIQLREDLDLVKTTYQQAEGMKGFQLYIFDGAVPETLPEDGSIIIFNPDSKGELIEIQGEFRPGRIQINGQSSYLHILDYVQIEEFHIAKASIVEMPPWGEAVLTDGTHPLMIAGERGSQRIALFPFDLHNTDLPLKTDFPILIQNLLSWMLPQVVDRDGRFLSGEEVDIHPLPHAQAVYVITPKGERIKLAPPFPAAPFSETDEIGIYTVEQDLGEELVRGAFTIQVPTHSESDLLAGQEEIELNKAGEGRDNPAGRKEFWPYFIRAAFLFILAEWWVYQRGY